MATHARGFITASTVSALLTGKGDKLLKGGITFCKQIALERFGVIDEISSFKGNYATEWGLDHEPIAISRYERAKFTEVTDKQKGAKDGWLSCTPDGYIGKHGLVEIKCPYSSQNHMDNLLEDSFVSDYNDQVQFQLMLTKRKWCDLVSFDPRWKEPLDLHIVRIEPDLKWQANCRNRIEQAEEIIESALEALNEKLK